MVDSREVVHTTVTNAALPNQCSMATSPEDRWRLLVAEVIIDL